MKTVLLHGLGQTAQDWDAVIHCAALQDIDCPELPALAKEELTYSAVLAGLERRYADIEEPFLKASKQLSRLLPQAELHIIPGAGHEVNKCAPEATAKILKR